MGSNDPLRPVQAPRVMPVPAGERGKIRRREQDESQEHEPRKRGGRESGERTQRNEEGGIDDYV